MALAMQHLKTQNPAGMVIRHSITFWQLTSLKYLSDVVFAVKLRREGMCFQASSCSPNDANVILQSVTSVQDLQPAHLLVLFTHWRNPTANEVYAIVEHYVELSSDAAAHDPYHRFGFAAAGMLYYDRFHPPEVVEMSNLVTQFAKTCFFLEHIESEVVHVLPIFKVCFFLSFN